MTAATGYAWVYPPELTARTENPVVGRRYAVFAVQPKSVKPYQSKASSYRAYECVVVGLEPLTVEFAKPTPAQYGFERPNGRAYDWRWEKVPPHAPTVVPDVACEWDRVLDWHAAREASADHYMQRAADEKLTAALDDMNLHPKDGRPTVTVDAVELPGVCLWASRYLNDRDEFEQENMRLRARVDELEAALEQFEAEEERDVLGTLDVAKRLGRAS